MLVGIRLRSKSKVSLKGQSMNVCIPQLFVYDK